MADSEERCLEEVLCSLLSWVASPPSETVESHLGGSSPMRKSEAILSVFFLMLRWPALPSSG